MGREGSQLNLSYPTWRISSAHALNVLELVKRMLQVTLDYSHRQVDEIDYLTERDRDQIFQWNSQPSEMATECAHEIIKRQVDVQSQALAISSATDGDFTYEDLDLMSTKLAHHLVQLDVGPDIIVPLCFEKSAWAVVAMLAVIKAGGAVVFVDPSHPPSRLQEITFQVKARMIVNSSITSPIWTDSQLRSVTITRQFIEQLPHQTSVPSTTVNPSNALYVVFTSGTTGKPKGCVVEHRNFCSGAITHARGSGMDSSSRVSQFASYTFDVSILEIITALIAGACICIPSPEDLNQGLAYVINKFQITWTFLTPSLARLLSPSDVPNLKTLILGGEALSKLDVDTWASRLQLINGYGPSECAVAAAANPNVKTNDDPSNIGRAVGGVCWIVDPNNQDKLMPVGLVGELLIQGPILARGYLDDPLKTVEVFVENLQFCNDSRYSGIPRRFYKTGDLARYNADGTIHFVGRKDTQVKLRGQRIELGEIEHHLKIQEGVQQVVVILCKSGPCRQKLVAVMSFTQPGNASTGDQIHMIDSNEPHVSLTLQNIKEALGELVPSYMVPSVWVVAESIPLMSSGKLNRAKVIQFVTSMDPATYLSLNGIEDGDVKVGLDDESPSEQLLRQVYSSVLNLRLEQIPLDRSFLSLGGDSVSAMQVVARCREQGRAVSIRDILRCKTVPALASCMGNVDRLVVSATEAYDTPFELSPVQQMYFAVTTGEQGVSSYFNQSFFLRVTRHIEESDCAKAVDQVVQRHSMLRAHFVQQSDKQWYQVVPKPSEGESSFQTHHVKTLEDIKSIIGNIHNAINFRNGPIFAASLFNTKGSEQYLFLVAHHLVVDLVSWRIIVQDLEKQLGGHPLPPAHAISFQKWLELQSEYAQDHLNPEVALPFSIPDPQYSYWDMESRPNFVGDIFEEIVALDNDDTELLLGSDCHHAFDTEPIDLLLSAVIQGFSLTFEDREVPAIFREGHGREPWTPDLDLSGTVGWFTTMYPLHIAAKGKGLLDIVRRAKDIRRKMPGSGWPYFASRFLNSEGRQKFANHNEVEVTFDYLGRYQQLEREDALFQMVPRDNHTVDGDVGPREQRFMLVEITAEVIQGQMQFQFLYNRNMKHAHKMREWASQSKNLLVLAIKQLLHAKIQYTLSDFPLLQSDYRDLDELINDTLPASGINEPEMIEDIYPCTPMQRGLLLSQLKQAGSYEYYHTFELKSRRGVLSVDRFIHAWQQVVRRHPALRTQFIPSSNVDRLYDQAVHRSIEPWVLRHKCPSADEASCIFGEQKPVTAFMDRVPHRLTLCTTADNKIFGKLELNHAIVDGVSLPVIFNDLHMAYDSQLPSDGPLFSDYVSNIAKLPLEESLVHWKNVLDDLEPCYLKFEQAESIQRKLRTIRFDIESIKMQTLCEQYGVTISNLLQAAWAIVLRQYTGMKIGMFGFLSSGREASMPGIEEAVGPFLTMLICSFDIDADSSLVEIVTKARDELDHNLQHQYNPLADIQHALGFSGEPMFNSVLSVQRKFESSDLSEGSLDIKLMEEHDPTEVRHPPESDNELLILSSTIYLSTSRLRGRLHLLLWVIGLLLSQKTRLPILLKSSNMY
jgi:amino acid adenylation domain-containing protein/non-ribosomal peptide synthase protein (TIGR01720 family)